MHLRSVLLCRNELIIQVIEFMAEYGILLENENASEIEAAVRQGLRDADPLKIPYREFGVRLN